MKRTEWTPANYDHDVFLEAPKLDHIRTLGIIGLGDVGITMVLGLMLYGKDRYDELILVDPNEANRNRLAHELNQIRSLVTSFPLVTLAEPEDLLRADMVFFVASVSVPKVGEKISDARLVQFGSNWQLLKSYAELLLQHDYSGLFGVVSDPVDYLATRLIRSFQIDPKRVMGFGQGVMAARAAYYGGPTVRMFGPHGKGLFVANDSKHFDLDKSLELSELTLKENLVIRGFGYKPYIAPALSSAAIAITDMLNGQPHYSSQFLGNISWGERYRFTEHGLLLEKLSQPELRQIVSQTYLEVGEAYESASRQIE